MFAPSERPTQRVLIGVNICSKDGDRTVYICRECGQLKEPCYHIKAYLASQARAREVNTAPEEVQWSL